MQAGRIDFVLAAAMRRLADTGIVMPFLQRTPSFASSMRKALTAALGLEPVTVEAASIVNSNKFPAAP